MTYAPLAIYTSSQENGAPRQVSIRYDSIADAIRTQDSKQVQLYKV